MDKENIKYIKDSLNKILLNQRTELTAGHIITIVIITLVTNIWSQYFFKKLGFMSKVSLFRLLFITIIAILIIWLCLRRRKSLIS